MSDFIMPRKVKEQVEHPAPVTQTWWTRNWIWVVFGAYFATGIIFQVVSLIVIWILDFIVVPKLYPVPLILAWAGHCALLVVFIIFVWSTNNEKRHRFLAVLLFVSVVLKLLTAMILYLDARFFVTCDLQFPADLGCLFGSWGMNIPNVIFAIIFVLLPVLDVGMLISWAVYCKNNHPGHTAEFTQLIDELNQEEIEGMPEPTIGKQELTQELIEMEKEIDKNRLLPRGGKYAKQAPTAPSVVSDVSYKQDYGNKKEEEHDDDGEVIF